MTDNSKIFYSIFLALALPENSLKGKVSFIHIEDAIDRSAKVLADDKDCIDQAANVDLDLRFEEFHKKQRLVNHNLN